MNYKALLPILFLFNTAVSMDSDGAITRLAGICKPGTPSSLPEDEDTDIVVPLRPATPSPLASSSNATPSMIKENGPDVETGIPLVHIVRSDIGHSADLYEISVNQEKYALLHRANKNVLLFKTLKNDPNMVTTQEPLSTIKFDGQHWRCMLTEDVDDQPLLIDQFILASLYLIKGEENQPISWLCTIPGIADMTDKFGFKVAKYSPQTNRAVLKLDFAHAEDPVDHLSGYHRDTSRIIRKKNRLWHVVNTKTETTETETRIYPAYEDAKKNVAPDHTKLVARIAHVGPDVIRIPQVNPLYRDYNWDEYLMVKALNTIRKRGFKRGFIMESTTPKKTNILTKLGITEKSNGMLFYRFQDTDGTMHTTPLERLVNRQTADRK